MKKSELERAGETEIEKWLEQARLPPTEPSALEEFLKQQPLVLTESSPLEKLLFPENSQKPEQK
jgi:hypothetical protein